MVTFNTRREEEEEEEENRLRSYLQTFIDVYLMEIMRHWEHL